MLQQRHPLANSRISSDCSAVGSSGDETLTVLAEMAHKTTQNRLVILVAERTFYILKIAAVKSCSSVLHQKLTAVSPNSFIITAIRYPWRSVKIRLLESQKYQFASTKKIALEQC
jgi:hypothetical protein